MSGRFHVRTFGCQMNEHDSERIAGLLVARGMEPTDDVEDADVVVFNTCCIRENADNKLYGQLGRLKELKERRPDLQIAVGGCLAQKDRELVVERAGHVDVVFGTHNLGRAVTPPRSGSRRRTGRRDHGRARSGPVPRCPPRRESGHSAWVTIQIGCDNSCAFCIVPQVRGAEVSRRLGDVVHEVEDLAADGVSEITLLGQNVNSYGRDLGAGQWSPRFADLLRVRRRDRGNPPRPVHVAAPEGPPSRTRSRPWPSATRSASTSTSRSSRGATGRSLACAAGTPPSDTSSGFARHDAAIPDLAVTTDIIVGFPGETDDDFARTLDGRRRGGLRRGVHVRVLPPARNRRGGDGRRLRGSRGRP